MNDQRLLAGILLCVLVFLSFALLDKQDRGNPRSVARIGILTSLSLILGFLESFLPDFLLPGMRIGLANIVPLVVLYVYGVKAALGVGLAKALIISLLRGNFLSMGGFMALTGTMLAILGMSLVHLCVKKFSVVGVSIIGALLHVTGQILVAYGYLGVAVVGYLPWLLLMAFGTGTLVGLISLALLRHKALMHYLAR